jgi:hypothetical protein
MRTVRSRLAAIAVALIAAGGLAALSPAGPAVAEDSPPPDGCEIIDSHETDDHHYKFYLYECPDNVFMTYRVTLTD